MSAVKALQTMKAYEKLSHQNTRLFNYYLLQKCHGHIRITSQSTEYHAKICIHLYISLRPCDNCDLEIPCIL